MIADELITQAKLSCVSIRLAEVIGEVLDLTGPSVWQIQEGACDCVHQNWATTTAPPTAVLAHYLMAWLVWK